MIQGPDYVVARTFVKDGEERVSTIPEGQYDVNQIINYFRGEGMTVIIKDMERRWNRIGAMAFRIEEELGAGRVNANLYVTPEAVKGEEAKQGHHSHWDSMDGESYYWRIKINLALACL